METLLLDVSLKLLYFHKSQKYILTVYLPSPLLYFYLRFKATGFVSVLTVAFWLLSL